MAVALAKQAFEANVTYTSTTQRSGMMRNSGIGLMVCALVFVALVGPGHAAEVMEPAASAVGQLQNPIERTGRLAIPS
jgi:hypothetical protein